MTEVELKKLSRADLLEMLLASSKENAKLREEIAELKRALESREIAINNAGSIAEAALQVNGVFAAAQKAAEQYLENVKRLSETADKRCAMIEQQARQKADEMLMNAQKASRQAVERAKAEAASFWNEKLKMLEKLEK